MNGVINGKDIDEKKIILPSFVFVELTSLAELNFLTNASTRIKYTCLAASPLYLAVGSSGGSVYLFSRYASKHRKSLSNVPIQVIPCKEGAVSDLKISPNETKVAVASSRGFVSIVNISGQKPSTTVVNVLHVGSEISALSWTSDTSRVYVGDTSGRVSCIRTGKTYFKSPCDVVLQLDSKIVQIDCYQNFVLVSTLSRCYLHDYARSSTTQIGKKLRSGAYGACFFVDEVNQQPIIFATRPGGRLWEANCNGSVYNTHHFTTVRAPVASVVDWKHPFTFTGDTESLQSCSLSFSELRTICDQFLISLNGSKATVLDPRSARVVLFANFEDEVVRFAVCCGDVFLLTKDASLRKLTLFSYAKAVEKLQYRHCYLQSAQLISVYMNENNNSCLWKIDILKDILAHLMENGGGDDEFVRRFTKMVELVEENAKNDSLPKKSVQITRLSTGIHKVVKMMENSGYDDDFAFRAPSGDDKNNSLSRRSRSSPMVFKTNGFSVKDSHSSSMSTSRDDTDATAPRQMESTMISSRSEESLISLLDIGQRQPSVERSEANEAPRVLTSAMKNGGKLFLKAFVQPFNALALGINEKDADLMVESKPTTIEILDDDAATPVAETPDERWFFDFDTAKKVKELSPVPNVIRRNGKQRNRNGYSPNSLETTDMKQESVNGENEQNMATYLVNGDDDESKLFSVRTTIYPESPKNVDKCEICSLHRSWMMFLRLFFISRRLPVGLGKKFKDGGVGGTLDDWTRLVSIWRCFKTQKASISASERCHLCSTCKSVFRSWCDEFNSIGATKSSTVFDEIIAYQSKTANEVPDAWLNVEVRRLEDTFFAETTRTVETQKGAENVPMEKVAPANNRMSTTLNVAAETNDDRTMCSIYCNPIYESFCEPRDGEAFLLKSFSWLVDDEGLVPLDLLACGARKTLDDEEFEAFLEANIWMNEYLAPTFFCYLVSYDNCRQEMPHQILNALLLDSFDHLSSYAYSEKDEGQTAEKLRPYLLDANAFCPCCTLPILAKVTEFESSVVLFRCGHSFHKVCLPNARHRDSSLGCLICCKRNVN